MNNAGIKNNVDRRTGIERREFSYTAYLPERRSGKDRRGVSDHKNFLTNEIESDTDRQQYHCDIIYLKKFCTKNR